MADRKGRSRITGLPRPEPWMPADWTPEDAYAVQALVRGTATEEQQRRGMRFIIDVLCARDDQSYRSGRPDDTAFAEGKRFVGNAIVKFCNLNIGRVLKRAATEQGSAPREPG